MVETSRGKVIDTKLLGERFRSFTKYIKWPLALIISAFLISPDFWSYWSNHNYNAPLVLDYINALKWPIVTLIVLLALRPHLPELVSRMRRAKGPGVDFEFSPPPGQQTISKKGKEEIEELGGDSNEPATEETAEEDLETLLTSAEAQLAFEQVHRIIYGTQIMVMKRLLNHIPDGLSQENFRDIFEDHRKTTPKPYPTINSFLQFLIDNSLVLYDVKDKRYKITNAGVYFLRYLQETNRYYIHKQY